jgi:hypothetical protein
MNLSLYFPKLLINLAILIPMCLPISLEAQWHQMSKEEYIKNHRNLAIKEMYENGIPASIKLAQAIIESGNGNSRLAREANNTGSLHSNLNHIAEELKNMLLYFCQINHCFMKPINRLINAVLKNQQIVKLFP